MAYSNNYGQNSYGNTNYTNYGAQGANDGGGFMAGSQGGGGGEQGGKGRSGDSDNLRPVTILQVNNAKTSYSSDTEFTIDGAELGSISIVGQVQNITEQTTHTTYLLEDGTGRVEVKRWISEDRSELAEPDPETGETKPSNGEEKIEVHMWVKVWGKPKVFGNKRHISAFAVRPIKDINEVNFHLLDATACHLYFTRGPPGEANANGSGNAQAANGYQNADTNMANGGDVTAQMPHLSAPARKVYMCLKSAPQNNEGMHAQVIATSTGMSMPDVMRGSDELLNNSVIFTTVDDMTWAILE